jgi:hypothetical protein
VQLLQVHARQPEVLQARLGARADVIGREDVVERILRERRPAQILWWHLGGHPQGLATMAREHLCEQLFALAIAVRERRVKERAPEFDRSFERRHRLRVVGPRPSAHAPEAIPDVGNRPTQATKDASVHEDSLRES